MYYHPEVDNIKELFDQGHWAGIHAVYNIYNATRLFDFIEWAKFVGVDTHWQSLYQPECLDPLKHSEEVRILAQEEIKRVLERNDLTDSERGFFEQAKNNYLTPVLYIMGVFVLHHTLRYMVWCE